MEQQDNAGLAVKWQLNVYVFISSFNSQTAGTAGVPVPLVGWKTKNGKVFRIPL